MKNLKFRHFAGDADFKNLNVAVYGDDQDNRVLIAEKNGDEICRKTVTAEQYSTLRERWSDDGKLSEDDVRITVAALEFVGAFDDAKKPGAQPGNSNAQRDDNPADATIMFRCTQAQKTAIVRAANARGQKLTAFVLGAALAEVEKVI